MNQFLVNDKRYFWRKPVRAAVGTGEFNMQTQTQLLPSKTMVGVEGVARKLDPDTNIWQVSRPVLEKSVKSPESAINKTIELSKDILDRIQICQKLWIMQILLFK